MLNSQSIILMAEMSFLLKPKNKAEVSGKSISSYVIEQRVETFFLIVEITDLKECVKID